MIDLIYVMLLILLLHYFWPHDGSVLLNYIKDNASNHLEFSSMTEGMRCFSTCVKNLMGFFCRLGHKDRLTAA